MRRDSKPGEMQSNLKQRRQSISGVRCLIFKLETMALADSLKSQCYLLLAQKVILSEWEHF